MVIKGIVGTLLALVTCDCRGTSCNELLTNVLSTFRAEIDSLRSRQMLGPEEPKHDQLLVATSRKTGQSFFVIEGKTGVFSQYFYLTSNPKAFTPVGQLGPPLRWGLLTKISRLKQGQEFNLSDGRFILSLPNRRMPVVARRFPAEVAVDALRSKVPQESKLGFLLSHFRQDVLWEMFYRRVRLIDLDESALKWATSQKTGERLLILKTEAFAGHPLRYYFSNDQKVLSGARHRFLSGGRLEDLDEKRYGTGFDMDDGGLLQIRRRFFEGRRTVIESSRS